MCVKNLRDKFPRTPIVVAKVLPAHEPGNRFHEDIKKTNAALDSLKLESIPGVKVLDLWNHFTSDGGVIKRELFPTDNIHLSPIDYATYANQLEPMIEAILNGKPLSQSATREVD